MNGKIKTLVRVREGDNPATDQDVYMLSSKGWEFLGVLRGSVGRWGESTGIFTQCLTTTPINEAAELLGCEFYWEDTFRPVAECL